MKITYTRHMFATADVYVDTDLHVTGSSRNGGHTFTVKPLAYYVEDNDDYGHRNRVTLRGLMVKKNGQLSSRQLRLDIDAADVPDQVWAALVSMRPDLTR